MLSLSKKSRLGFTPSHETIQPKIGQPQVSLGRKGLAPLEIVQKARKFVELEGNLISSETKRDLNVISEKLNLFKFETRSSSCLNRISMPSSKPENNHKQLTARRLATLNDMNEETYTKRSGRGSSFENSLRPTLKKEHHQRSKSIGKIRVGEDGLDTFRGSVTNKSFKKPERLNTDFDAQRILSDEPMRHLKPCRIPLKIKGLPSNSELPEKEPVKAIEYLVTEGNFEYRPQLRKRPQVHQYSMRSFLNQKIEKNSSSNKQTQNLLEPEGILSSNRNTFSSSENEGVISSGSSRTSQIQDIRKSAFFENSKMQGKNKSLARAHTEDERDSRQNNKQSSDFLKVPTTDRSRYAKNNEAKSLKRAQSGDLMVERELKMFKAIDLNPLQLKIRKRKIFNPFSSDEEIFADDHQIVAPEKEKSKDRKINAKGFITKLIKALRKMKKLKLTTEDILDSKEIFSSNRFENDHMKELLKASKSGKTRKVEEILYLKGKYLVYGYDELYQTALHWAAKRNCDEVAQILIENGADVDAKDIVGRTPLYFAIKNNSISTLKVLLANHAEPWVNDDYNYKKLCGKNTVALYYVTRAQQLNVLFKWAPSYLWSTNGMNMILEHKMGPTQENITELLGNNNQQIFNSTLKPRILLRQ